MRSTALAKTAVVLGVAAAILIPAVQQGLGLGLSQAAFASQGDATLRAEGYAFSIWGLIYIGLVVFAVHQARARDSAALSAIRLPAASAALTCGLWIVAAAANWMWGTLAIILFAAAAAVAGLLRAAPLAQGRDRVLAVVPVALLAGWLTVAAPLNALTVLTAMEMVTPRTADLWALAGIAAVLATAGAVAFRSRVWAYPLPTAWGLAAVYIAERTQAPVVAWAALGAAALLAAAAAATLALRRRP